ncbi:GlxA family transcriptional regulator [Massilia sp. YIM B02763]|uniref:GlxA family transcriptional regulator n=1 Tax=Massilia sp. YIM B02763 TaxID=3050130 RepID=UPI0025B68A6E|nr:GlxA family transcriptional regulator [Massilia sp. YIM B02763]MDN4054898.1 GlxA family transcriptional regulator [Massilia sp. YIM B02763]
MIRDIAIVAFPGFQLVDLAALNVFELANRQPGGPRYRLHVLSRQGGPVPSSAGVSVGTVAFDTLDGPPDTMIVFGGDDLDAQPRALLDFLAQAGSRARRTASICSGVFLLAAAGLVEGRSVTTHWNLAAELQRRHPGVRVEPDRIFINDGPYWTSAGMTAGVDLALALVEQDLGSEAAREIARHMVVYYRRSGGQSQFSSPVDLAPRSERIQAALAYARGNLCRPLSLEELADAARLSRRQFSRSFRAETGQTPARAVEQLRVQAARELIETTSQPIEAVARESGFLDPERMRRAFLRAFGHPPQAIKRQARAGRLPT